MIVVFTSSETGELMIMADLAKLLLKTLGKECTEAGVITQPEMAMAIARLESLSNGGQPAASDINEAEPEEARPKLAARVWPLLDMLRRTQDGGSKAYVMWKAPRPFSD